MPRYKNNETGYIQEMSADAFEALGGEKNFEFLGTTRAEDRAAEYQAAVDGKTEVEGLTQDAQGNQLDAEGRTILKEEVDTAATAADVEVGEKPLTAAQRKKAEKEAAKAAEADAAADTGDKGGDK